MLANKNFYNVLAENYDEMISFDSALEKRIELLKNVIRPGLVNAADIGCGTGLDSIALTKLGLNVTAFDTSDKMIKQARNNASVHSVTVKLVKSSVSKIGKEFDRKFDLLVSLGNTFANIPDSELFTSIWRCRKLLRIDGIFIIQVLNYNKILIEKKRIIRINASGNKFYIRFYDFLPGNVQFNILSFGKNKPDSSNIITTVIYPHTANRLKQILNKAGFRKIKLCSDLNENKFTTTSDDLFVIASA